AAGTLAEGVAGLSLWTVVAWAAEGLPAAAASAEAVVEGANASVDAGGDDDGVAGVEDGVAPVPGGAAMISSSLIIRNSPVSFTRTVKVLVCGSEATTSRRLLRSSACRAQLISSPPAATPSLPHAAKPRLSRARPVRTIDRAGERRYVT